MSFLFGGKKQKPPADTALPAATRNITSAHGERTMIPTANIANSLGSPRQPTAKPVADAQKVGTTPPQTGSVSSSVNSFASSSPEPNGIREISDGPDIAPSRAQPVAPMGTSGPASASGPVAASRQAPQESPYPWSQRRLNFSANANPFPRYGAAVNSSASKEGWIYLMGGLVNSSTAKGDLWMVEATSGAMACYPVQTPSEGPGPRVGHASLLVGNAFIVFGGDTKQQDEDMLDDALYLLNTASKQWSKALPAGPRPSGRYGHTLNILGPKIYVFGGQVEGFFFNDLVAFDLNALQVAGNRWQMLIPNSKDGTNPAGPVPAPRTNHTCVTWQDKLYLFGGTDGSRWFNDVWTYDPRTNSWTELDCIGYIPAPREGHAAALVDDTMYIFGGRVQDGSDLGDLAAFRISSRRWYMFQNMGPSPSARSGHSMTAYGKNIVVLGGEPSSAPHDPKELSLCYILDTSKIRYPPSETAAVPAPQVQAAPRKFSAGERSAIPVRGGIPGPAGLQYNREMQRPGTAPSGSGPPPLGQAPQPRTNGFLQDAQGPKATAVGPSGVKAGPGDDLENTVTRTMSPRGRTPSEERSGAVKRPKSPPLRRSQENSRPGSSMSRTGSRANRNQGSLGSIDQHARTASLDDARTASRNTEILTAVDSGIGSSPALSQQHDELLRELEGARSRNAWYASELALARKAGYQPTASSNAFLDEKAADTFGDDDRPLVEALLRMRSELARVQTSLESQATESANRVTEAERQRDAAVNEAMYAKAKLAAHGGSADEVSRDMAATPDADRTGDLHKRLAAALTMQSELQTRIGRLGAETETERRARQLAEDTAIAAEKRVAELEAYRQRTAGELEGLRAELHEAERTAREEAASSAEAVSAHRLLEADHRELSAKHAELSDSTRDHTTVFANLHQAVTASTEKATLLESQLGQERQFRDELTQQHTALRAEHEARITELEQTHSRLRDAQQLAERHAEEARTHREAVLSGLGRSSSRGLNDSAMQDDRAEALQQQVQTATALARRNQEAADLASEKLRRAEERIAGLEAYQEQSSREGLSMRKQLQITTRDHQALQGDKADLLQQLERHRLDSNALEVQLKTLKGLLEERGVTPGSAADRRSRALDSPSFRNFGTPDQNRVRELEQQLEAAAKSQEELRHGFEQREAESNQEYNQKLATLETDHQAAVKYVRGIERMLSKMKQELQRTKTAKDDLEKELASHRADVAARDVDPQAAAKWDEERESLRAEMNEMQESMKTTMADLENQTVSLKTALDQADSDRQRLQQSLVDQQQSHQQQLDSLTERARADLDHVRRENIVLAERAKDAENKVQMFLDQFETSVDNYRRQSRMSVASSTRTALKLNGVPHGHSTHDSVGGASLFSNTTSSNGDDDTTTGEITPSAAHFPHSLASASAADDDDDADVLSPTKALSPDVNGGTEGGKVQANHSRDRSSTALDSLASELDALRTHWETTNKNYRLSDRFDFEKSPTSATEGSGTAAGELGESLASWRRKLDLDETGDVPEGLSAGKDSNPSHIKGH